MVKIGWGLQESKDGDVASVSDDMKTNPDGTIQEQRESIDGIITLLMLDIGFKVTISDLNNIPWPEEQNAP